MLLKHLKLSYRFSVRVRYAPSPTGPMHLGAVRTALFNYMFARHNKGKFIVRIQDTDLERNIQGSAQQILDTLDWLGISPDQSFRAGGNYGPYIQSQRLQLYKQIQNQLLRKGLVYPCFCEHEKFKKKEQREKPQNQVDSRYDGKCRKLSLEEVKIKIKNGEKYVIRIKSDISQLKTPTFKDQVYGPVATTEFDDFILVKKNGYPTYHFANVIDDWKMGITHVIRGVQWLTNTSKHLYLYNILQAKPPTFMHLPLIFTADGKKLSKRDPTTPIMNLKQKGYLPQAIINYTGIMGFNPKSAQENKQKQGQQKKQSHMPVNQHYSLQQLCDLFQIYKVRNNPIKSDNKKLNFFNRYYMRRKLKQNDKQFVSTVINFFRNTFKLDSQSQKYKQSFLKQVLDCIIERVDYIQQFKQYDYFFGKANLRSEIATKDIKKMFGQNTVIQQKQGKLFLSNFDSSLMQKNKKIVHNLRLIFVHVISPQQYTEQKIAQSISKYLYDNKQLSNEDVYHILRLAVTGRKSGVNIVKTCQILGQKRVQQDLQNLNALFSGISSN